MDFLTTIFSSIFTGGATGIIGVIAQRWADYKNRQLDIEMQKAKQDHEIQMRKADAEIMAQEWAARTRVAEVEAGAAMEVADSEAFAESYRMEPALYSASVKPSAGQAWMLVVLDFVRGSVRPILTLYLSIISTLVYIEAQKHYGSITPAESYELMKNIIGTIMYLWVTIVLWWFGTRNKSHKVNDFR
jgi:hypothetical protein